MVHVLLASHVFLNGLSLLAVEVQLLNRANLFVKPLDFKLISIYLRLVILELLDHFLQLIRSLLQILLIDLKFLSYLGTRLFGQDVFQFNIQFFFFLNQHIFLRYFFGFCNQPFLQRLDLLNHFISLWIGAF